MHIKRYLLALSAVLMLLVCGADAAPFKYRHDPRLDWYAMKDVVTAPRAVYGFAPDPRSARLGPFARAIDWSDREKVAEARAKRLEYMKGSEEMLELRRSLNAQGKSEEEIARALVKRRNELRIESYHGDKKGLDAVRESNLKKYGHPDGPTADMLYERYGSWREVTVRAFDPNAGMDACLGLYDDNYDMYIELGHITGRETEIQHRAAPGDTLWSLAVRYYGSGPAWRRIKDANARKVRGESMIFAGSVLVVPR